MRVAVIGGKLQGVEACYLAKKAGWEIVLFDRRADAQARGLADTFHCLDVHASLGEVLPHFEGVDLVIPAVEDKGVLKRLKVISQRTHIPFAFDAPCYEVSSSKRLSNKLFQSLGIPVPRKWPECRLPILLKPSAGSGSEGVRRITSGEALKAICRKESEREWIIEEYLEGPSYSIEVFGFAGAYRVFQITELEMDRNYDCKRVLAPSELDYSLIDEFEEVALKLAAELALHGIMDVEAILHEGKLKVLEIDARLPSQTPTAVYHSSGINMIECLGQSFVQGSMYIPIPKRPGHREKYVIYEHLKVTPEKIEVSGEHILTEAGPLALLTDFLGADEVLTDYAPGKSEWVMTLITRGATPEDTWEKRGEVLRRIQMNFSIPQVADPYPADDKVDEWNSRRWQRA